LTTFGAAAYTVAPMTSRDRPRDSWQGMSTGWAITGTMVGGIAAWGGIGFLADRLIGTEHVCTGIGFVVGALGAGYIVWLRYGRGAGDGS
jgi:F0F1-type ATP synthase assembly protein I